MRVALRLFIVVAVPLVLVMGVVRLLTLPWYPAWEYAKPGFPEDPLAMAPEERLRLARASIAFLNMPRGVASLDNLRFADGTAAFNAREIGHMDDVKLVYDRLTAAALIALVIAAVAAWLLLRQGHAAAVWGAVSDGSLLILCVLVGLGAWMAVGFEAFFTAFHGVFFEGDTWLFAYTDTLIRLFPLQFWSDAGLLIAAGVGCIAFVLALFGRAMQKRLAVNELRVRSEE
ncbi:MAG TPA: TIGR01906 family membrane protein [Anaerolineae bacterium]|nr:TIGR01906 family membrane protein [Anaerolineae bacterium]HQI82994.1 TIGR01906 family membrane protein [Anaerolineae bacterium]